jgi:nucleotide-binding universal stress UspA family protein
MDTSKNILVAIDDSEASIRAMTYVATMLGARRGFRVLLVHVLPPVPPKFYEFGGSEDPEKERQLEAELHAAKAQWIEAEQHTSEAVFARAKDIFRSAHVPASAIETQCFPSSSGRDVVEDILQEAHTRHCDTIVVGRESFTGLKKLVTPHIADTLVRRGHGLTVWIVE